MKIFDGLYGFLWTSMSANNCNTYLLEGSVRVMIDPGHLRLFEHVTLQMRQLGLELPDIGMVFSTHAHPDHFEAASLFKQTSALFAMTQTDWQMIEEMGRQLGPALDLSAYTPDFFLKEGELKVGGLTFQVIDTPGHSPGSVSLYWAEKKALFTGDLIFRDGLGRTDLPGGSGRVLKESIKRLSELDAEWLLPGHGDIVSGAEAVKANFKRVEQTWFSYI